MAIIDLDSHLRDGWLFGEIYQLPEPFARYTPRRIGAKQRQVPSRKKWTILTTAVSPPSVMNTEDFSLNRGARVRRLYSVRCRQTPAR
jgi:hypothetical protein